jgi:flagellar hook-associated protein 3 FlgL
MAGIGRIATGYQSQQSNQWLQQSQVRLNKIQEQASLGRKIIRASDDPLGLTQLLSVTRSMNEDEQYIKNIATGVSELKATDAAMTQMVEILQRAKELATQGSNVTTGANGMLSISKEVNLLTDQLVQLGNFKLGDIHLFAGSTTDSVPYTRVGDVVTYSGTPSTGSFQRQIDVAKNSSVTLNVTGDTLLGDTTAGVFKTMIDLKNALAAADTTTTRTQLDLLTTQMNSLLSSQATIGSTLNQLNATQDRTQTRQDSSAQLYSTLQDVDMPKLVTDLRFQEQINQSSLGVMARILPQSLFSFLR